MAETATATNSVAIKLMALPVNNGVVGLVLVVVRESTFRLVLADSPVNNGSIAGLATLSITCATPFSKIKFGATTNV
jgi:hypothetical protein